MPALDLSPLLDRERALGLPPGALLPALASLLVLRWLEVEDGERAAIAAFQGEEASSLWPDGLTWDQLRVDLVGTLQRRMAEIRAGVQQSLGLPMAAQHPALATPLPPALAAALVEHARSLPLDTPVERRAAGQALGELIRRVVDLRQGRGELATLPSVARLMVALADVRPGDRVYDPCFGTGNLLAEASAAIWRGARQRSGSDWAATLAEPLSGVEINADWHLLGFVRLLLLGFRPALALGDALLRPPGPSADVVLASPPWGGQTSGLAIHDLPVRSRTLEGLFLQHAVRALRPGGRAVLHLPRGFLAREGADALTRRWVQQQGYNLDMVLDLPAGALAGHTRIASALVVLRNGPPRDSVLMVDLAQIPEDPEALARLAADLPAQVAAGVARSATLVPQSMLSDHDHRWVVPPSLRSPGGSTLTALRALVPMVRLDQVAQVIGGRTPPRERMGDLPFPGAAPLAIVGDLAQDRVELGSRFARLDAPDPEHTIRQDDLLLSLRGTIGKLALGQRLVWVPGHEPRGFSTLVRPIAGAGLAILRPGAQTSAAWLHAMLRSDALQSLLRAMGRGVAVQGVSLTDLRKMEVPVPPLALQERVLRRAREQQRDALEELFQTLRGELDHPVARLLHQDPDVLALLRSEPLPAEEADERVRRSLAAVQAAFADPRGATDELPGALDAWAQALTPLQVDLLDRRKARARGLSPYTTLRMVGSSLREAAKRLEGAEGELVERASLLTERWWAWRLEALERAALDFGFAVYDDPRTSDGAGGGRALIEVTLTGTADLFNLRLGLEPGRDRTVLRHAEPGRLVAWEVDLYGVDPDYVTDDMGFHRRALRWSATRQDDVSVSGELQVEIGFPLAQEYDDGDDARGAPLDLGPSPYVAGDVVLDPNLFVGRKEIISRVLTQIDGGTRVVLLEGNRRAGKTSVLSQLQQPRYGLTDRWIPVYSSFQGATGDAQQDGIPTESIFRMLVKDIALAVAAAGVVVPLPEMGNTDPKMFQYKVIRALPGYFHGLDPYEALCVYVDLVTAEIAPRRLLLMLDEFDKVQVGIERGVTSPLVPENLRHLTQTRPAVGLILSGSRRLKHLRESYWSALFGIGYRVGLDPLSEDEARDLVTRPVAGRLSFRADALTQIVRQTACHPYLVQLLAARIFEVAKERGALRVEGSLVDEAIARTVQDNEHFAVLWGLAETPRRRYLLCLVRALEPGPDRVSVDLLWSEAERVGVVATIQEIDADLDALLELELIRRIEGPAGAGFALGTPLMGAWMRGHVDDAEERRRALAAQQ